MCRSWRARACRRWCLHASYALDLPPGAQVLADDSWSGLVDGMCAAMDSRQAVDPDAYTEWEMRQARPLGSTLRHVLMEQGVV